MEDFIYSVKSGFETNNIPFEYNETNYEFTINKEKFKIIENLKTIHYNVWYNEKNFECYDNISKVENINYYFICETPYHAAFGHWVFETLVFLPYLKYFPKCKLLLNESPKRNYKNLFIDLFDIKNNSIYYKNNNMDSDNIDEKYSYNDIPPNNICIICDTITANSLNFIENNKILFESRMHNIQETILKITELDYTKKNNYLFFKRSKEQNFIPNDRIIIDYTFVKYFLKDKSYIEYDTINTINFKNQLDLLASSKNIFLDYGSSLFVNGLFCKDSIIYITDMDKIQLKDWKYVKILWNMILNKNNKFIDLNHYRNSNDDIYIDNKLNKFYII